MSTEVPTDAQAGASDADVEQESNEAVAVSTDEDERRQPVDVEHGPPRLAQVVSLGAVLTGTVLTAPFALLALPFGIAGLVIFAAGLFVSLSRGWLSIGAALILGGAIITGGFGAVSPELMLIGIGATILGWDVGQHGIKIGEQLGRRPRTRRIQVVHTAISGGVIGFISALAYLVFLFAGGGRPASAVGILVLGVVIMAWVFRS